MGSKKESMILKGFDCSEFQGIINWNLVKTDFAIIRAGFGTARADYQFIRNRDEVRRLNIPHGFYWYSYPNQNTPELEAEFFLQTVGELKDNEILFLDMEEAYVDPVGYSKKFLETISLQLNGYKPLFYSFDAYIKAHDFKPLVNANYGLWYANYNGETPENPSWNTPWSVVPFWQYTDKGSVHGIAGNVDLDCFYGDINAFNAYGFHAIDPCATTKTALQQAATDRDQNWNIVTSVGQQLKISPDPNNKPATATRFIAAIRQLQDDSLMIAKGLQDITNQFDDYKKSHPKSSAAIASVGQAEALGADVPNLIPSTPQPQAPTGNSSFKNSVVSLLKFLKIGN